VFKLLKLGVGLVALTAIAWFGITVKLGSQTLFQHLRAIGQTRESQDLVDGTKQAAGPLVDDVRRSVADAASRRSGDAALRSIGRRAAGAAVVVRAAPAARAPAQGR
jgi:hypothetical protein